VLSSHAFSQRWAQAVLDDKLNKRRAVYVEGLEHAVHAACFFALSPRRQQLSRNQLMVAALIGTLTGLSLDRGTSSIFPGASFVNLTFISIEMFATAWHLQASARLEL
jgi:hypothetical protein